ncbi:TPA: YciY family protein, partial [Klebsiella pneumoniae]|nr:YciY family protein [Klebsiella pneumoniae]
MSLRISIFLANKNAAKAVVSCWQRFIMGAVFTRRVVAMKRSRTEVGRWRMLRQVNR